MPVSPSTNRIRSNIKLERVDADSAPSIIKRHSERGFSPHESRWAAIWRDHPVGVNSGITEIVIERAPEDLLLVRLTDVYQDNVDLRWLNEKLLLVKVWWGRVAATEMILDVSKGSWIYQEIAHYGDLAKPCSEEKKSP